MGDGGSCCGAQPSARSPEGFLELSQGGDTLREVCGLCGSELCQM